MRLKGQVAVVTGGSQGIGEALAKRYAAEGAKVAILNRNEAKAQSVVRAIQSSGGDAIAFRTDVSRIADIERAIAGVVETYGTIHILVNNAAAYLMSPLGRNQRTGGRHHAERQRQRRVLSVSERAADL